MPWYTADKEELASKLKSAADDCKDQLSSQHEAMDIYVSLFQDGRNMGDSLSTNQISTYQDITLGNARSKYNIIRALSSAALNRIASIRPGVECITVGGEFERKHRAKMLNDIIRGLFRQTKAHKKMQRAFLSAAVRDVGIVHVWAENGQPQIEVVNPKEILFDPSEACEELPGSLLRRKLVDRKLLQAQFPKSKKAISDMPPYLEIDQEATELKDNIEVIEAHRLATVEGQDDGRHAIVAGDVVLCDEKYSKGRYPYVFIQFEPNLASSIFGAGVANLLLSLQWTINQLIDTIEGDMKRSAPMMLIYEDSEVSEEEAASNERMRVVRVKSIGMEPKVVFTPSVSPEMERKLEQYKRSAFDIVGISQPSAQGAVPAGLDSGKAIRAHEDVQDSRFVVAKQAYQDAHVEVAELLLGVCQDIANDDESYEVTYRSKGAIERVKWKEVIKDLSDFVLEVKPIGALSSSLPGRMQEAKEMMDLGLVENKEQAAALLDFPDLEEYRSFALSQHNAIEAIIDRLMVPDADPIEPDEYLPVDKLKVRASQAYAKGLVDEIPEKNLDLLRDFMDRCDQLIQEQQAAAQPTQAAMPMPQQPGGQQPMPPEMMPQ